MRRKSKRELKPIESVKQLKVGMRVLVGYPNMKKTAIDIRRWDTEKERKEYKRYWEYCIKEGIVWQE